MKFKNRLSPFLFLGLIALLIPTPALSAQAGYDELVQQALQERNAGNFIGAEELLEQARAIARETNEVDFLLGMMQAFQERFIEAQNTLETGLETYPEDISLRLARARVLSYQGIYDEAVEATNQVLSSDPANTEALNLRARIYYYQNRHSSAREDFRQVLAFDSENLEAVIGLYDIALATNDDEQAESYLAQAQAIAPDHVDVVTRRERLRSPIQKPNMLTVSGGGSDFDVSGLQRWYDRSIDYRYFFESGNELLLNALHAHRFGRHDTMIEAGFRFARPGNIPVEIAFGHTAAQEFLPENQIRLSSLFMINNAGENFGATTLDVSFYHSSYQTGSVNRMSFGFTHYLLDVNAWITPGVGLVRDENGDQDLSWNLGAHWQTSSRLRLGYNFTHAPETENSRTVLTLSHHVYGHYQLSDGVSIRLDASSNDRRNAYTRDSLSLALQFRF